MLFKKTLHHVTFKMIVSTAYQNRQSLYVLLYDILGVNAWHMKNAFSMGNKCFADKKFGTSSMNSLINKNNEKMFKNERSSFKN